MLSKANGLIRRLSHFKSLGVLILVFRKLPESTQADETWKIHRRVSNYNKANAVGHIRLVWKACKDNSSFVFCILLVFR